MTPKPGEVYMVDLGIAGKVRPAVIVSREDANSPRALSVAVPLTSENRGSKYEVKMPRVPWLRLQSYANVQAINSVEHHELLDKKGRFEPAALSQIREAIKWALEI
jgi:mRNA interferase MazF